MPAFGVNFSTHASPAQFSSFNFGNVVGPTRSVFSIDFPTDDHFLSDDQLSNINIESLPKMRNGLALAPVLEVTKEEGLTVLHTCPQCETLRFDAYRGAWAVKAVGPLVISSKKAADGSVRYRATIHCESTKHLLMHLPIDTTFGVKGCNGRNITVYVAGMDLRPTVYCLKCPNESDSTALCEILTKLVDEIKGAN